jgi:hypothetical protein
MKEGPPRIGLSGFLERIPHRIAVPLLLLVFGICGYFSLARESATFDETTHLPSGITYLERFDFRHNPEHPPLAKMWAALPVWLSGRAHADYSSPHWTGTHVPPSDPQRSRASQWLFGYELLNGPIGSARREDPRRLLLPARTAMLVLGLLLAVAAYRWSLAMWGRAGALVSLLLCCTCPTLLAHARLVTTDLPLALGFTVTLWSFWRYLERPGGARAATTGAATGVALLTKFSSLLLLPVLVILGIGWAGFHAKERTPRKIGVVLSGLAGAFGIAYVVLWAGYGFRYAAVTDPGYRLEWESMNPSGSAAANVLSWAKDAHALPEAYLFGLSYAGGGAERRLAFLNGEESVTGWWYYFPEAFLLKTPLAFLILIAWVGIAGLLRRGGSFRGWYLAIPVLLYFLVSIVSPLNIGHRHLVPIYPLLYVGAGAIATLAVGGRLRQAAAGVLVAGCVASFALATPRYLSYFNVLAGGPGGGWRYLVDSNIDWGQDLPRLRSWMDAHRVEKVHLAYFGTADPAAYGISFEKVVMIHDFHPGKAATRPGKGDVLAVSVTLLQGVYLDRDRTFAEEAMRRRLASRETITRWLALRDERIRRQERFPTLADWMTEERLLTAEQRREVEAGLLPTWMSWVRDRLTPIGRAGDSILLYRLPG